MKTTDIDAKINPAVGGQSGNKKMKYAAINENQTAFGVGESPAFARNDAHQWCDFADQCEIVEITEESYRRILDGNPDAVDIVEEQ